MRSIEIKKKEENEQLKKKVKDADADKRRKLTKHAIFDNVIYEFTCTQFLHEIHYES